MSKISLLLILIVIIALGVGVWYLSVSKNYLNSVAPQNNQAVGQGANNIPSSNNANTGVNPQDTSDSSINKDLSNIDNQINGLSSDAADINQSLNNQ